MRFCRLILKGCRPYTMLCVYRAYSNPDSKENVVPVPRPRWCARKGLVANLHSANSLLAAGARTRDCRDAKQPRHRRGRSGSGVPESPVFLPGRGQKNAPKKI
jgi:hypothetical protein